MKSSLNDEIIKHQEFVRSIHPDVQISEHTTGCGDYFLVVSIHGEVLAFEFSHDAVWREAAKAVYKSMPRPSVEEQLRSEAPEVADILEAAILGKPGKVAGDTIQDAHPYVGDLLEQAFSACHGCGALAGDPHRPTCPVDSSTRIASLEAEVDHLHRFLRAMPKLGISIFMEHVIEAPGGLVLQKDGTWKPGYVKALEFNSKSKVRFSTEAHAWAKEQIEKASPWWPQR